MELVACLSTGKGTWGHVNRLAEDPRWSKIILITNDYGKENFTANEKMEVHNEIKIKFIPLWKWLLL